MDCNKLNLNNSIIALKPFIEKARGQAIQKVIRQIKKLKTEEETSKKDEKLNSLSDEINVLKKLDFWKIVKTLLLKDKEPKDSNSLIEIKCIARIQRHKILSQKLVPLKEDFNSEVNVQKFLSLEQKHKKRKLKDQPVKSQKSNQNNEKVESKPKTEERKKKQKKDNLSSFFEDNTEKPEMVESKIESKRTEDSFFVTSSGTSYLANAETHEEEDSLEHENIDNRFEDTQSFKRHTNFDNFESRSEKNFVNNNSLHPSWEAKMKSKPKIAKFEGKKIIFDKTSEQIQSSKNYTSFDKFENDSKKDFDNENLHPSWEAKKKAKPLITKFEGKKITFD